jgi:hypothetical protein
VITVHICPNCQRRSPCLELECGKPREVACEFCVAEAMLLRHEEERWRELRNLPRISSLGN